MPQSHWNLRLGLVAAVLFVPAVLGAQAGPDRPPSGGPGFLFHPSSTSLGVSGGFMLPHASGGPDGFFPFVTRELTLGGSDFNAVALRADLTTALAGPLDVVFGAAHSFTSAPSEFRDWVDQNDRPITQRTRLSTTSFTAAARLNLTSRGRRIGQFVWIPARVLPYIGVGTGAIQYSLRQDGQFVDFRDLSIFSERFTSKGWTAIAFVMAGTEYSLGKRLLTSVEARYQWANGRLDDDFVNFDDGIDLSGLQFSMGLHVRM